MIVAHSVDELPAGERTVAIGSFDGVHRGHRRVLETARAAGGTTTVVTFWPHPRLVLGNRVELLSTLERRLELLETEAVDEVLVVAFTPELAALEPEQFAESLLQRIGASVIVVGENFRFGRAAAGDPATLEQLGFDVRLVGLLADVSSTRIRALLRDGDVVGAARLLGRPAEVEGTVVLGDQRGGTLGFPTANLAVADELLVPAYGIYAGAARGHKAAISIGVNPHYGGHERRIEPYLLDFEGDLYGERLVVELWQRLREERAFDSEQDLVAQIARDVQAARAAEPPV
ncbi:MAG: riboflavin biosynthesis protein RibF [Actinobacteria bacterium]|nr:MAG: riboflavin biosynthesis protein RibF [Actinomycetota bacterium]